MFSHSQPLLGDVAEPLEARQVLELLYLVVLAKLLVKKTGSGSGPCSRGAFGQLSGFVLPGRWGGGHQMPHRRNTGHASAHTRSAVISSPQGAGRFHCESLMADQSGGINSPERKLHAAQNLRGAWL